MSKVRSSSTKGAPGSNTSEDEDWSEGSTSSSRSVRSLESYREEISSRKGWLKKKSTWSNWKDVFVVVQGGIFLEFKKEDVREALAASVFVCAGESPRYLGVLRSTDARACPCAPPCACPPS